MSQSGNGAKSQVVSFRLDPETRRLLVELEDSYRSGNPGLRAARSVVLRSAIHALHQSVMPRAV